MANQPTNLYWTVPHQSYFILLGQTFICNSKACFRSPYLTLLTVTMEDLSDPPTPQKQKMHGPENLRLIRHTRIPLRPMEHIGKKQRENILIAQNHQSLSTWLPEDSIWPDLSAGLRERNYPICRYSPFDGHNPFKQVKIFDHSPHSQHPAKIRMCEATNSTHSWLSSYLCAGFQISNDNGYLSQT